MPESKTPYTPEQLAQFRKRLLEEQRKLVARYQTSRANLREKPPKENIEETGSEDFIHAADLYMMGQDSQTMNMIQNALKHLEEGNYGICEDCGGPLGEPRLLARPFARYCIKCKSRREAESGPRR